VNALLLPIEGKLGAIRKVEDLVKELEYENIDWKFVTNGLRAYMFDYMYDIAPFADKVLPLIFHFIGGATERKRDSSLRACDTFFDRYSFVLDTIGKDDDRLEPLKKEFAAYLDDYIDILINISNEGFYLLNSIETLRKFGTKLVNSESNNKEVVSKLVDLLFLQYRIYVERSIKTNSKEISEVKEFFLAIEPNEQIIKILSVVSEDSYAERLETLDRYRNKCPEKFFEPDMMICDFTENQRNWERICITIKNEILEDEIKNDQTVINIVTYLVMKLNQGLDPSYQKNISRTLTSICTNFVEHDQIKLFKKTIGLVMPVLFSEIEQDGNYAGAFSRIYDLGKSVIESKNVSLIDHFEDILIKNGFCFPEYGGIASDWSVISNGTHIENIRTWMKLIELHPPLMKKLSASLIANLKLGGVFLKDTDVFQRDISKLLNSNYQDVFYLITSLALVFPTFYHNIGATGNIRSYTERLDTNHQMDDLIHFIRKQVHVESSNRTVTLIQRAMEFWMTGDNTLLQDFVPTEVQDNLDHFYRMINLDTEDPVRIIYENMKENFEAEPDARFWDLLDDLDSNNVLEYIEENDFENVGSEEKREIIEHIQEYYDTNNPTEMTKILYYIKDELNLESRYEQVWDRLYAISDDEFRDIFEGMSNHDISKINIEKFVLLINVYRMLYDKYNFSEVRAIEKLEYYESQNLFNPPEDFFEKLKGNDLNIGLDEILKMQETLKSEILLSESTFEPLDTIEFKRHITFGIPSMYGFYKEKKFDTLRVFFHMNSLRLRNFERIIEDLNIEEREMDYDKVKWILKAFQRTYKINGLANQEMNMVFDLLDTPNLMTSQLEDILTQLLVIHGGIADRFNETFRYVCKEAINKIGVERIKAQFPQFREDEDVEIMIDRFLRDQIMQTPLLQLFDTFVVQLNRSLSRYMRDKEDLVCLNKAAIPSLSEYYKERVFKLLSGVENFNNEVTSSVVASSIPIYRIQETVLDQESSSGSVPIWDVGNKAYGLLFMRNINGVNVPDGIILASYLYRVFKEEVLDDEKMRSKLMSLLKLFTDSLTKNRFGNPNDPELLSVRSGAVFFMPGVMDTITNVGLTPDILKYYSQIDEWFAYDCYRRFLQDLATSFYDVKRSVFENIITATKKELNVQLKEKMTGEQMKALAQRYRDELTGRGYYIPEDPYEQLLYSIIAAYRSWDKATASNYRTIMGISDEWGTGIIIQKMILGNKSQADISGVVQSNYHGDEKISLFGEYKTRAQGYDLVSGVAKVFPISDDQKRVFPKYKDIPSLEEYRPEIYKMIYDSVWNIRDRFRNEVQIEFTVEDNVLYLLQVRGLAKHQFLKEEIDEEPEDLQEAYLGQGLAASGGATSGRVVFNTERIGVIRTRHKGDKVILILPETNPEDVVGLKESDGVLTCLGGMTSHAVLQMRRFKKTGVSDFSELQIDPSGDKAVITRPTGEKISIKEGDFLTIDGNTGKVYLGQYLTTVKTLFDLEEEIM